MYKNPYTELNDYELLHLIPHLIDIERFDDVHKLIGSQDNSIYWFDTKNALNLFESYIGDLRRAISIAFYQVNQELSGKKYSNVLALVIKYGLIFSSLLSSSEQTLSPTIVAFLVSNNYWNFNRAMTYFSVQEIEQTTNFLLRLFDQHFRGVSQQTLADNILNLFPKVKSTERKLTIMTKLAGFLPKTKTDSLLNNLLAELIESKFNEGLMFMDEDMGESKLSDVAKMIGRDAADMLIEAILISIKLYETPERISILLNSLEFVIGDSTRLSITQLIISEIESSNDPLTAKANWYIELLVCAPAELKNDICNLASKSIQQISGNANVLKISLLSSFLPAKLLIPVFQSVTQLIQQPNNLGQAIASITKRAVELENVRAISLIRKYIDEVIDDPCVKVIATSGLGRALSKKGINQLLTVVFEYRTKYKNSGDISRDTIYWNALDHLISILDQQGLTILISNLKKHNEKYIWEQALEHLVSVCEPKNLEDLYISLKENSNPLQQASNLIYITPYLSENLKGESVKDILLSIDLIEGDEFRKGEIVKDFIELLLESGLIIPNIDILHLSDLSEMVRSVMELVDLSPKNSLQTDVVRELLKYVNTSRTSFSKAVAFSDIAYHLNKLSPKLREKNVAVLKSMEIGAELNDYFNFKISLQLISSLPFSQQKALLNTISESVDKHYQKTKQRIVSPHSNRHDSSIYTDLALITAELQDYETSIYFATFIVEWPHRTQILRWLKITPQDYIRNLYKITIGSLDYALGISHEMLVNDSVSELCYLAPYLPSDLILEIIERLEDFNKFGQLDIINALIPSCSEDGIDRLESYCRAHFDKSQLVEVQANILSRYVQLGKLEEAILLLDDINIPNRFIKNALEIYSVRADISIKNKIINVFLNTFVPSNFLPIQKDLFARQQDVSIELIQSIMLSLDVKEQRGMGADNSLNPYHIASTLINNLNLSPEERLLILEESLMRIFVDLRSDIQYFRQEDLFIPNSVYRPASDAREDLGGKALRILEPGISSLELRDRVTLFQRSFEYFMNQPRKTMLSQIAAIFPSLQSIGNEDLGNKISGNVIQVWTWWP